MPKLRYSTEDKVELQKLIQAKEPEANLNISYIFYVMSLFLLLAWFAVAVGFFSADLHSSTVILLSFLVFCLICSAICNAHDGRGRWKKYLILFSLLIVIMGMNVFSGYRLIMFFCVPVITTCRYSNIKYTTVACISSAVFTFLCAVGNAYFSEIISADYGKRIIADLSDTSLSNLQYLSADDIFKSSLRMDIIPNLALLLAVSFVSVVVIRYNRRLMFDVMETTRKNDKMELDVANSRSKIMLSQIQPHFIYNSLSAIMAIDGNPDKTVEAIATFSGYLRENLDALSDKDKISFKSELSHIEKYVAIEKLRFKDDLMVLYNIRAVNFEIPTLSTQILVENAIKHGIMEKENGGTVWISSYEDTDNFYVSVKDDGIGFDVSSLDENSGNVGIKNVKLRLLALCNGSLDIKSEIGKGTTAVITIPKKGG